MLKFGIVGDGNDGIAPFTGCPVPVPTSKPDQYTPNYPSALSTPTSIVLRCAGHRIGMRFPSLSRLLHPSQLDVITSRFGKSRRTIRVPRAAFEESDELRTVGLSIRFVNRNDINYHQIINHHTQIQ
jgi:hypothetical protein